MRDGKEKKVYHVFESIAPIYDGANVRISLGMQRRWKGMLIREVLQRVPAKGPVLDVCCGTGDIALGLASHRPGLRVAGLDFSRAMLAVARRREQTKKHRRKKARRIVWIHQNARTLPFKDNQFAAAVISFGLRNTNNYEQVLREMKRVVRPGGFVFCLDSFVPEFWMIKPFYALYFHWIMPLFGGGRQYSWEYRWLWRSTQDFLTKEELAELMGGIGLGDITYKTFLFGACVMHRGKVE